MIVIALLAFTTRSYRMLSEEYQARRRSGRGDDAAADAAIEAAEADARESADPRR